MPTFGHLKRDFPRLEVLRGFDPNEPRTQTAAYRVKALETILSGMVISPVWNAADSVYEWQQGVGTSQTVPVYFALQDSVDADVLEAGNLVGLSCAGQFELQTPFYDEAGTYNEGTLLTPGLTNSSLTIGTVDGVKAARAPKEGSATRAWNANNGAGYLIVAGTRALDDSDNTALPQIVGQVTRATNSGSAGSVFSVDGINSNVVYKSVITFRTTWQAAISTVD